MQNCDFDDDGPPPIIKPRSSNPEGPCKSIRIGRLLLTDRGLMGCSADDTHGVDPRPVGTVFLDDLVRVGDIGAGAQGVVTKYKHATTKERYAVKVVQIPTGTNTHDLLKKVPEVRNVVKQHHPNTVPLFNAYLRNNQLILVMEYMGGGNVAKLVQQGTPVPEKIAAYVVSQVANALAHIHRKHKSSDDAKETSQVHRDIKPANILLSRSGAVKLADFGVAGNAGTQGLSSFVGTITYMSPERVMGHYHHTSSDVWSLGVVAAELLLGRNPFSASEVLSEALGKIAECKRIDLTGVAGISTAAQAFLDRCVVQDPATRWSAAQLLEHEWITSHVKDPEPGRLDLCQVLADLQRREPA